MMDKDHMTDVATFDDLLEDIGSFGVYQKVLCMVLIPLTTGFAAMTYYAQIFALVAPPHTCKQNELSNSSHEHFTPVIQHFEDVNLSCFQYNRTEWDTRNNSNWTISSGYTGSPCNRGWTYNFTNHFPTLTSENDWVCEENWKPFVILTVFSIGTTLGVCIYGALSDKYGRKPTIAAMLTIYSTTALMSLFTTNFYLFAILRFCVGLQQTANHIIFVYVLEQVGVNQRAIPMIFISLAYTCGSTLSPLLAKAIWDWKILLFVSTVPISSIGLLYRWLPESPSWLAVNGRAKEAKEVMIKIAKINGNTVSSEAILSFLYTVKTKTEKDKYDKKHNLFELFRYRRLLKNCLVTISVWMLACFTYYGLSQNAMHISDDIFTNFFVLGLVELPAASCIWMIQKFGRKPPLITSFLVAGTAEIVHSLLVPDYTIITFGLAVIGKMAMSFTYCISMQLYPEVFPTTIRGQGVGLSGFMGGVATFISPSVVYLGEFHLYLPPLIFGVAALVGAIATYFVPETAGLPLPQTLEDGDEFGR